MATLAPADVYRLLIKAGFSPSSAVTMTAIAGGESSWNTTAVGDVGLQTDTWGPSVGLFQVRTLKADQGRGTDRDQAWLLADVNHQAKAAYDISSGGTDFSPWTVYNTGAYRQYLTAAEAASGGVAGSSGATGATAQTVSDTFPTFGPNWLPWNWPSDAANAVMDEIKAAATDLRTIALEALGGVLALVLIGYGVTRIAKGPREEPQP